MNEMALPTRHRIQNSSPGALRLSTLPLVHGGSYKIHFFANEREETFCVFEISGPEWG